MDTTRRGKRGRMPVRQMEKVERAEIKRKQTEPVRNYGLRELFKNYASQKQERTDRATRQVGNKSDRSCEDCRYCEDVGAGFCVFDSQHMSRNTFTAWCQVQR